MLAARLLMLLVASQGEFERELSPEESPFAVDLCGVGSLGLGETLTAAGIMFGGQRTVWRGVFVRASGGMRSGRVPQVSGASMQGNGALGAGVRFAQFERGSLSARGDVLALFEAVSRFPIGVQSRWLPGVDLFLEGEFAVMPSVGTFVAVGVEAALGTTELYLEGQRSGSMPALRGVAQIGVRTHW